VTGPLPAHPEGGGGGGYVLKRPHKCYLCAVEWTQCTKLLLIMINTHTYAHSDHTAATALPGGGNADLSSPRSVYGSASSSSNHMQNATRTQRGGGPRSRQRPFSGVCGVCTQAGPACVQNVALT
jgi:hypothetical protein